MIALTRTDLRRAAAHGYFARVRGWLDTRARHRIDRDAYRNLLKLDDHMLRDIGVTRDEVIRAANLPLSHNAALELQAARRRRR